MRAWGATLIVLAAMAGLAGCGDSSIESDADMREALEQAGISCDEWVSARSQGDEYDTNRCDEPKFIAFRREATEQDAKLGAAVGQETARCIARQWSLNPDDPTGETFDHLVMDTWTVWGPSESIEAVRDEIGGDIFTKDDEPPSGVSESDYRAYAESDECSPIAPLPSSGGSTSSAQPTTSPGTSANPEPCVENCVFSVADVVRDLDGILCKSQDEYAALQGDITDNDRLQTAADQILVCENGGSNDLSSYGIVYLWRDFNDMAPALETFSSCDAPGVTAPPAITVYGGNGGNPGYLVANIQSGEQVASSLMQGGAEVLCGP